MALTLEAEQRMQAVGATDFYLENEAEWLETVRDTRSFVGRNFPDGVRIRMDDVQKALIPILEVHEGFRDFRSDNKLRGKYWVKDFADLLLDRTWRQVNQEQ